MTVPSAKTSASASPNCLTAGSAVTTSCGKHPVLGESPPSGAEFRVANRCAQKATLTYPKVRAVVDVPTWRACHGQLTKA